MAILGPGAVQQEDTSPAPLLEGANEFEYVEILNPLTDDFAVRVAQDVPVNMPLQIRNKTGLVKEEGDVVRSYGLDLKNPDHQAKKYIVNDTVIPAGKTIRLKGNEAQVAVKQLVDAILQIEGKSRLLADPTLRREVESRIIQGRGSIQDLMDGKFTSARQQATEAINQANEVKDEEFPGLKQENPSPGEGVSYTPDSDQPSPKKLGRPKKANTV